MWLLWGTVTSMRMPFCSLRQAFMKDQRAYSDHSLILADFEAGHSTSKRPLPAFIFHKMVSRRARLFTPNTDCLFLLSGHHSTCTRIRPCDMSTINSLKSITHGTESLRLLVELVCGSVVCYWQHGVDTLETFHIGHIPRAPSLPYSSNLTCHCWISYKDRRRIKSEIHENSI